MTRHCRIVLFHQSRLCSFHWSMMMCSSERHSSFVKTTLLCLVEVTVSCCCNIFRRITCLSKQAALEDGEHEQRYDSDRAHADAVVWLPQHKEKRKNLS